MTQNGTEAVINHTELKQAKSKKDGLSADAEKGQPPLRRSNSELVIDRSGLQWFLPKCLQFSFADPEVEGIYRQYYKREKRRNSTTLFQSLILVDLVLMALYGCTFSLMDIPQLVFLVFVLCYSIIFLLLRKLKKVPGRLWDVFPYIAWSIQIGHVICDMCLYSVPRLPGDSVSWMVLYTYMVYLLFPLRLGVCVTFGVLMAFAHLLLVVILPQTNVYFGYQLAANLLLFVCSNLLGMLSYFFTERRQRGAFLETRQSLEAKLVVEEESQEQERLLLSVLPKHVAAEIRDDLGGLAKGQFKKIYMDRHENVSILFADIVGFTAISSACTAPELVRILNKLFARFDQLSEKYHQLRIKILGDCYYCISGAPDQRPDHAVLCVHMGLSMVDAIRSVREETKSTVDMRVGVHTGAVLAGVLGQRQWQFDVYSRDVVLANKMESGGLAGRVHISEITLGFLNGEFEVTNADGASREEALRQAGINTYFIVKVLKPYPQGTLDDVKNEENGGNQESKAEPEKQSNETDYNTRLKQELLSRDNEGSLYEQTNMLTLCFKDPQLEGQYRNTKDIVTIVSTAGLPLTLLFFGIVYFLVLKGNVAAFVSYPLGFLITAFIVIICVSSIRYQTCSPVLQRIATALQSRLIIRVLILVVIVMIWILVQVLTTVVLETPSAPSIMNATPNSTADFEITDLPQYLSYFCIIELLAITVLTHLSYLIKSWFIFTIAFLQGSLNILVLRQALDLYDLVVYSDSNDGNIAHHISLSVIAGVVAIVVILINRQLELTSRRLFLWRKEAESQKEKVADLRRKNEALVYNILPPHVAKHFLGQNKKDEELYSKTYEAVGVLFASMPNFSDFYTEDSVNNQGLECLRFLNEVISDYDALLEQHRFRDIIKIKTIGATYMAASGLNDEVAYNPNAPIREKWAHLAQLTEFALTLKETLTNINKESFNNFVLRMGINQGPITAGVIGARKPHYDMWGNTVNVSSRMESTGKAGCIQVVEETARILEEFDFVFEQRGLVAVKGKGNLMTYYLLGKRKSSGLEPLPGNVTDSEQR